MKHKDGKTTKQFVSERYVTCSCGYNNEKGRLRFFGTCLRCGKILDERVNFKRQIINKLQEKNYE